MAQNGSGEPMQNPAEAEGVTQLWRYQLRAIIARVLPDVDEARQLDLAQAIESFLEQAGWP